jgi:hypothetical protein
MRIQLERAEPHHQALCAHHVTVWSNPSILSRLHQGGAPTR